MSANTSFRTSMNWLHTWAGLLIGALLFVIFWMGTLTVFDKEIDRWMMPESRLAYAGSDVNFDDVFQKIKSLKPEDSLTSVYISRPSARVPYIPIYADFEDAGGVGERMDPNTGDFLGAPSSLGASDFIFPFHFMLHLRQPNFLGYWIVGFAALSMMTLLVSGVIIHRKIFVDFFTFRPQKKIRRSSLDLHNVTGVLFLPFHFLIAFSGLVIFAGWYASLPWGIVKDITGNSTVKVFHAADEYGLFEREVTGEASADKLVSLSSLVERAENLWTDRYGEPARADRVAVSNLGDKNVYVGVYRAFPRSRVEQGRDAVFFNPVSGEIIEDFKASPIVAARKWLEGFHFVQFSHWPLRWFYFLAGAAGCVLIGSGFVFWVESRRPKNIDGSPLKVRVVEAISVGSTTGVILATGAFLVSNRLLSNGDVLFGQPSGVIEVWAFFIVWALSFAHAAGRNRVAWAEQALAISLFASAAVILNWVSTSDNLIVAASRGLWSVVGVDLVLIFVAAIAALVFFELRKKPLSVRPGKASKRLEKISSVPAE